MEQYTAVPGRVVISRMGRDAGNMFMIHSVIDKDFVLIVDGQYRKLANPKRKRVKHLKMQPEFLESIAEKLEKSLKVFDSEVKSALLKIEKAKAAEKEAVSGAENGG